MPNELNSEVLRNLARMGAQARLEQIDMERRAILAAFPELGGQRRGPGRPAAARGRKAQAVSGAATRRRGRRAMTAAQRKEVSDRMKRYWAERRKTKGKG